MIYNILCVFEKEKMINKNFIFQYINIKQPLINKTNLMLFEN